MKRLLLMLLIGSLLAPLSVYAQSTEVVQVRGSVEHGAPQVAFNPRDTLVTLNVLEGVSSLSNQNVTPETDGSFSFEVRPSSTQTLFFSVEYQGATYSASRTGEFIDEPVVLTVFESTHDVSVLKVQSHTVIVTGAIPREGFVEILERSIIRNNSDTTLIPDTAAEGPAMLSFLRFALPPNAYNLDVRSNLVGGQVLEVDRGFALTTPIVPTADTPHQFEFVYRLNYDRAELDLSRTMRFGAESVRFVAPVEVGRPFSSRLRDLGATDLDGRLLRLLEGQSVAPGEVLQIGIDGLPMRSALQRIQDSAGTWYLRYIVPSAMIVVTSGLLALVLRRRRLTPNLAGLTQRERLLKEARQLRTSYDRREVTTHTFEVKARRIRADLVNIEVKERLANTQNEGHAEF